MRLHRDSERKETIKIEYTIDLLLKMEVHDVQELFLKNDITLEDYKKVLQNISRRQERNNIELSNIEEEEEEEEEEDDDKIITYNIENRPSKKALGISKSLLYYLVFPEGDFNKAEIDIIELKSIFPYKNVSVLVRDSQKFDKFIDEGFNTTRTDDILYFRDQHYALFSLSNKEVHQINNKEINLNIQKDQVVTRIASFSEKAEASTQTESWGIKKLRIDDCNYTGKGIKICVLDSGFDHNHPDFVNRTVVSRSFIDKDPQDYSGHAMHCIGIACGGYHNKNRYGVALNCEIYAGKVLNNIGRGHVSDIIKGIEWAIKNKCHVINISIEVGNNGMELASTPFFTHIKQAVQNGCMVVVSCGNKSDRKRPFIAPISSPADSQYASAISAIDVNNKMFNQSNGARLDLFQQMNFTAPGVKIYSTWSQTGIPNALYNSSSGTSMSAPFITGIIALIFEKFPNADFTDINYYLRKISSYPNNWDVTDVGFGLPNASLINQL